MFRNEKLQLKKRKNAALKVLLLSAFVTFMCFSMLVGTSYAWFTDSVTSSNNKIVSGKLDVQLFYYNDQHDWVSAEGDVFADVVWEPGRIYQRAVEIRNNGNLPIKFAFKANSPVEYGSINTEGNQFLVSDALRTYQNIYDSAAAVFTDVGNELEGSGSRVQSHGSLGLEGFSEISGEIAANESKFILLIIEMPSGNVGDSTAVSDATTKEGMPSPKFDVELIVVARQGDTQDSLGTVQEEGGDTALQNMLTEACKRTVYSLDTTKLLYEKTDENNNSYYEIKDKDDFLRFAAAVNNGEKFTGKTVKLVCEEEIDLDGAAWPLTGDFEGTFNGNGKKISNFAVTVSSTSEYAILFNGTCTVSGLTAENVAVTITGVTDTNVTSVAVTNGTILVNP